MNIHSQGKGDADRTSNFDAYRASFNRIFGPNKKKKLKLTGEKKSLDIKKTGDTHEPDTR